MLPVTDILHILRNISFLLPTAPKEEKGKNGAITKKEKLYFLCWENNIE